MKEFLTIIELSQYLNMKKSTLYSMVERGEIPYFRFRRLIRFKKQEIDAWIEDHRKDATGSDKKAKKILKKVGNAVTNIDVVVNKAIEEVKNAGYTPNYGKPDRIKGLRKEAEHGSL